MKDIKTTCKIALVQAEPVMFNKSASLKRHFNIFVKQQAKNRI